MLQEKRKRLPRKPQIAALYSLYGLRRTLLALVHNTIGEEGENTVISLAVLADEDDLISAVKNIIRADRGLGDIIAADNSNDGAFGVVVEIDITDGLTI